MDFKLQPNLQRSCCLCISLTLWEQIEEDISAFFLFKEQEAISNNSAPIGNYYEWKKKSWNDRFIARVLQGLHVELPQSIKNNLSYIIISIGWKIYNWHGYLTGDLRCTIPSFPVKLYWKPSGAIDQAKTMESLDRSQLQMHFMLACNACHKQNVAELWPLVKREKKINFCYSHRFVNYQFCIVMYWWCVMEKDLNNLVMKFKTICDDYYGLLNENHSLMENLFRISVADSQELACYYFWNQITYEERNRNMVFCAKLIIMSYLDAHKARTPDSQLEILTFLLQQMSQDQLHEMSDEYMSVLYMFTSLWPWHELVPPLAATALKNCSENAYKAFIGRMTMNLLRLKDNSIQQSVIEKLLLDVYCQTKDSLKSSLCKKKILRLLLNSGCLRTIKIMLADKLLMNKTSQLLIQLKQEDRSNTLTEHVREFLSYEVIS